MHLKIRVILFHILTISSSKKLQNIFTMTSKYNFISLFHTGIRSQTLHNRCLLLSNRQYVTTGRRGGKNQSTSNTLEQEVRYAYNHRARLTCVFIVLYIYYQVRYRNQMNTILMIQAICCLSTILFANFGKTIMFFYIQVTNTLIKQCIFCC